MRFTQTAEDHERTTGETYPVNARTNEVAPRVVFANAHKPKGIFESRRFGYFYAAREIVEARSFFSVLLWLQFIPLDVEFDHVTNRFNFLGFSPEFAPVATGCVAPTYEFVIDENGKIEVSP